MDVRGNDLAEAGLQRLRERLPPGWVINGPRVTPGGALIVEVVAPDRRSATLNVEVRARLDPRGVLTMMEARRRAVTREATLVITRYLSASTRERLCSEGVGYIDLTGNIRIVMAKPGLFVETQGAAEDPDRQERPARSLRGAKAGRVVRVLIDSKQPPGTRALAAKAEVDPGYASRVLALLDTEALIVRTGRGRIEEVNWPALLRRWGQEAPLESRGTVLTYLEPRGIPAFLSRLGRCGERYAVSGSLAAARLAPIAASRLAVVWMEDAKDASVRLGLRPATAGANVLLVDPIDDGVFIGIQERDGVWYAAPSQVAADLLTSPGRGPAEAEELIAWMSKNEESWRG